MGFDVKYEKDTEDSFELVLSDINRTAEITEKEMMQLVGNKAKAEIEAQLRRLKRTNVDRKGRPALADDVTISNRKDGWGNRVANIKGGKKTGTLWHLVNDGNLYSRPTFFIDTALNNLDKSIDGIWDKVNQMIK